MLQYTWFWDPESQGWRYKYGGIHGIHEYISIYTVIKAWLLMRLSRGKVQHAKERVPRLSLRRLH